MFSIQAIHSSDTPWSHHLFVGEAQDRAEGKNGGGGDRERELDEASRKGRRAQLAWLSGDL